MEAWAVAVGACGIPDGLFWALTPVETAMLMDARYEERRQRREFGVQMVKQASGLIAATVANASGRYRGRVGWRDFFDDAAGDTAENLRTALLAWGDMTDGVTVQ